MGRKRTKPLGQDLKVSEINRIADVVFRLGGVLNNAEEQALEIKNAFNRLEEAGKKSTAAMQAELYRLCQSGNWLITLLGGCKEDITYIKSHLKCIITLLQMEAAKKLDEQEGK